MRIQANPNFSTPPKEYSAEWMEGVISRLEEILAETSRAANGGLGFGDGLDMDNLIGKWMTYTTNAVADTEDTLAHNLAAVPIGFLLMLPPKAGFIYRGPTAWTASNLYLKCSAASQTVTIFVLQASHGIQTL